MKTRVSINVHFVTSKRLQADWAKRKAAGEVVEAQPTDDGLLRCKITVRGAVALLPIHGVKLTRGEWNVKAKRVLGRTAMATAANAAIAKITDQLTDLWADLERQAKPVTAARLAALWRKNGAVANMRELFAEFMAERETLIGVEIGARTVVGNQTKLNRLHDFLTAHKLNDLRPEEFTHNLADKCLYWLMRELNYTRSSANKVIRWVFQVLRWAERRQHLDKNPLDLYKFKHEAAKEIVYLEAAEVATFTAYGFTVPRLEFVRDCFIFQCWTGLAYADLAALDVARDAETGANGRRFLRVRRAKSTLFKGFECVIPLLPEAERLLAKYQDRLPVPSNQKYNEYLKEAGELAGLGREKMNSHVGRKTAGTLMLNKGIAIEAVSKFLGHSNTKITQKLYAKLLDTTVVDAFDKVFGAPTPPPTTAAAAEGLHLDAGRVVPMYRPARRMGGTAE